jgi:hypothetical protein
MTLATGQVISIPGQRSPGSVRRALAIAARDRSHCGGALLESATRPDHRAPDASIPRGGVGAARRWPGVPAGHLDHDRGPMSTRPPALHGAPARRRVDAVAGSHRRTGSGPRTTPSRDGGRDQRDAGGTARRPTPRYHASCCWPSRTQAVIDVLRGRRLNHDLLASGVSERAQAPRRGPGRSSSPAQDQVAPAASGRDRGVDAGHPLLVDRDAWLSWRRASLVEPTTRPRPWPRWSSGDVSVDDRVRDGRRTRATPRRARAGGG